MDDHEFKKYVELTISMCTDYLMDSLNRDTFLSNLDMINKKLRAEYLLDKIEKYDTDD